MIKIEGLSKSYPLEGFTRYHVFRDLNLSLPAKTHIGIVGRNGVGKSTLLRLIGGMELPDSGRIRADGTISPPLGLSGGFAIPISGRDNARFVCRINGDDAQTSAERMKFIEDFAELGPFIQQPVETYSSGMRARLAFAISMAFDYDYYLIDELTAVGDHKFRAKAQAAFNEKKGRASIVMVSHNLDQLKRDCQVGVYMKQSGPVFYESMSEALDDYQKDQKAA